METNIKGSGWKCLLPLAKRSQVKNQLKDFEPQQIARSKGVTVALSHGFLSPPHCLAASLTGVSFRVLSTAHACPQKLLLGALQTDVVRTYYAKSTCICICI